jgi:hypothetical protein
MASCPACGGEIGLDEAFCGTCGAQLTQIQTPAGLGSGALAAPPGSDDRLTLIPGTSVVLGDGEKVWREYAVCQLRTKDQGEGKLFVTDSRVIFFARARGRATQRASALVQETRLADITGLTAYISRRISLLWVLAAVFFTLFALGSLVGKQIGPFVFFAVLAGISILVIARGGAGRGGVGVRIQSGATQASPIGFGEFDVVDSLLHRIAGPIMVLLGFATAFDVLIGFPGEDAEKVVSEIGALIIDLQTKGSLAGTHWGVETE